MVRQLILILAVMLTTSTLAFALPTIVVDGEQLSQSAATQTTSLDIWVQGNGETPIDLAGFQLRIALAGPDELVKIVGFGGPDAHPYLFDPTSALPSGRVAGDGLSVDVGDFLDTGTLALDDGDGLASLMLEVQPGALGSYQLQVSLEPTESFLAQSLTEFVAFDVQDGAIHVFLAGDYDRDNDVDGADFLKWQRTFRSTEDLMADGNHDGVVDAGDYTVWRNDFGANVPLNSAVASVPEPKTSLLASCGFVLLAMWILSANKTHTLRRRFRETR